MHIYHNALRIRLQRMSALASGYDEPFAALAARSAGSNVEYALV